jgi:transposase-like protein
MSSDGSIQIRTGRNQKQIEEQLSRTPIVEVACQKVGIGRNSYYRWRRQNKKFALACDKAIEEGCQFINDLAESQLITAMKNNNLTAVMYWLNHRSPTYSNKLELSGSVTAKSEKLTPEQETSIKKALKLMMLSDSKGGKNAKQDSE